MEEVVSGGCEVVRGICPGVGGFMHCGEGGSCIACVMVMSRLRWNHRKRLLWQQTAVFNYQRSVQTRSNGKIYKMQYRL